MPVLRTLRDIGINERSAADPARTPDANTVAVAAEEAQKPGLPRFVVTERSHRRIAFTDTGVTRVPVASPPCRIQGRYGALPTLPRAPAVARPRVGSPGHDRWISASRREA
jgi:hypothetical protein